MINGAHTIFYAADAEGARAFFRDVLGLPHVDAGDGWLIFKSPPAELAVHPAGGPDSGNASPSLRAEKAEFYLMCDDLPATVEELQAKGVEFTGGITQAGWGLLTTLVVPGASEIGLYQPRHETAYDLD